VIAHRHLASLSPTPRPLVVESFSSHSRLAHTRRRTTDDNELIRPTPVTERTTDRLDSDRPNGPITSRTATKRTAFLSTFRYWLGARVTRARLTGRLTVPQRNRSLAQTRPVSRIAPWNNTNSSSVLRRAADIDKLLV